MFALGQYPTVKLTEAREKCEQARKQVADGVSPTQARQLDKIRKVNDASNTDDNINRIMQTVKGVSDQRHGQITSK